MIVQPQVVNHLLTRPLKPLKAPAIDPTSNAPTEANTPIGRPLAKQAVIDKLLYGADNYLKHPTATLPNLQKIMEKERERVKMAVDDMGVSAGAQNAAKPQASPIQTFKNNMPSLQSAGGKVKSYMQQPWAKRITNVAATPTFSPSENGAIGDTIDAGVSALAPNNIGNTAQYLASNPQDAYSIGKTMASDVGQSPQFQQGAISTFGKIAPKVMENIPSLADAAPLARGALGAGGKLFGAIGTVANYANEANTIRNYEGGWDKYMADGNAINSNADTPGRYAAAAWENMGTPLRTNVGFIEGAAELPGTLMDTIKSGIRGQQQQAGISEALQNSINTDTSPLAMAASGRGNIAMTQ